MVLPLCDTYDPLDRLLEYVYTHAHDHLYEGGTKGLP